MAKKPMATQQRYAIQRDNEKLILKVNPKIPRKSGIYAFYRTNEKGENCIYIGQAKNILYRTAQHLMGRKQHIDKSLYTHKLYSFENPEGWKVAVLRLCSVEELDKFEQSYIEHCQKRGSARLYNICGGGQFDKAEDVGERYEVKLKTYRNGKAIAHEKARLYVKNMFDKYLDYTIKGKPTKTKERKFAEFGEFLAEAENKEEKE